MTILITVAVSVLAAVLALWLVTLTRTWAARCRTCGRARRTHGQVRHRFTP